MIVQRGTRDKLEKYFDVARPLTVTLQVEGSAVYDYCCFGVDADDKLSDDRYMIFYNQLRSPNGEIIGANVQSGMSFTVKLNALPQTIQKLVFTASIDGAGTMGEISSHKISIGNDVTAQFNGSDFQREKAITSLEIYRKGVWRFNVVARGFNGGLDALLAFYGGECSDDDDVAEQIEPSRAPTLPAQPNQQPRTNQPAPTNSNSSRTNRHNPMNLNPARINQIAQANSNSAAANRHNPMNLKRLQSTQSGVRNSPPQSNSHRPFRF